MVGCLGLLFVGIAELGSKRRHYSSREAGRKRDGAVGCKDCRGPAFLSSFSLSFRLSGAPPLSGWTPCCCFSGGGQNRQLAPSPHVLRRLMLCWSRSQGLGARCEAWPGGRDCESWRHPRKHPCILLPRAWWICSYFKRGSAHFNIYLF